MEKIFKRFSVALDIKRSTSNRDFETVEADNGNVLEVTLTDDGHPVDLAGCLILAVFSKSDGRIAEQDNRGNGISVNAPNKLTIELYPTSFAPGLVECELQVYSGAEYKTLVTSAKFNFMCRRAIVNPDTLVETHEWPILIELIRRVETMEVDLRELTDDTVQATAAAQGAAVRAHEAAAAAEGSNAAFTSAEALRVSNEQARVLNESARLGAEEGRLTNETTRVSNEQARVSGEQTRVVDETARLGAEQQRVLGEIARAARDAAFRVWEAYDGLKPYVPLNKVSHNGSSYLCVSPVTGVAPPDAAYWLLIAAKGLDGTGAGDMTKAVYDPDDDGIVNAAKDAQNAQKLGDKPPGDYLLQTNVSAWAKAPVKPAYTAPEVGAAAPAQTVLLTLTPPQTGETIPINSPLIKANSTGSLRIAQGANAEQYAAWGALMPQITAQTAGSCTLTVRGTMPTISIPLELEVRT